jgi:hypothetical protein
MRRGHSPGTVGVWENGVFKKSVRIDREPIPDPTHSILMRISLMVMLMLIVSLFEEDVDSTFFNAAPGRILMYCTECRRQRTISAALGSGPEAYCSGGRIFEKHEKTKMLRLGIRNKEISD